MSFLNCLSEIEKQGKNYVSLVYAKKQQAAQQILFIPNELDFMHEIIIPGVHEIVALVAKKLSPRDPVRFTFGENSSGLTASRFKCFAFSPTRGITTFRKVSALGAQRRPFHAILVRISEWIQRALSAHASRECGSTFFCPGGEESTTKSGLSCSFTASSFSLYSIGETFEKQLFHHAAYEGFDVFAEWCVERFFY